MRFRDRFVTLLLTTVLTCSTLLGAAPPVGATASAVPVEPGAVAPAVAAEAPATEVIRQGYEMLLDRFVQPLEPAELLSAAYTGVVEGLTEAGAKPRPQAPLQLPGDRAKAWSDFEARLQALLKETPVPPDFNLSGVALAAMARSVNEGHTAYMTPEMYRDLLAAMRGDLRYGGIGLRPRRPGITVAEVFPDSPAQRAGIQAGDQIVAVDGQQVDGMSLLEVAQLIRGPEGTPVQLEIVRPANQQRLSLQVVRASIKIEMIRTEMIQDDVAYVALQGFTDPTAIDKFERFLDALPSSSARGLIIDLRGNGGGRIDLGMRLLNRFVSSGPVIDMVDREGRHRVTSASGPGMNTQLPIVVLVDDGTASMGEIFTAALRDRGLARVIGSPTAGNVAAAQVFPLSDGAALQVTIAEIYSGKGELLNGHGVIPDDLYGTGPEDLERGRDIPLEAAVLHIWTASEPSPAHAGS